MLIEERPEAVDRFTWGIVRRKVRQLIGRAGFARHDREDLEQELLLRVLQSWPRFDPDRAHRNKFVTTVVERHVASMLRNRRAEKRDARGVRSLNVAEQIGDEEQPSERARHLDEAAHDARLGRWRSTDVTLVQLTADVADVIAALPEAWRMLLELRKTRSLPEVSRVMGVPRTTLQDWLRRIRAHFEAAGLREYLAEPPSSGGPTG